MPFLKSIKVIAACTPKFGIGKSGSIPWDIPNDMNFFKEKTTSTKDSYKTNAVIMGRSTWTSLGGMPLKNRYNCILSNSLSKFEGSSIYIDNDLSHMINTLNTKPLIDSIYIIGGSKVYEKAFEIFEKNIKCVYLNIIHKDYECDRKIILPTSYIPVSCETEKVFESRSKEWVDMDKCIYEYTDWEGYLP
jgi:dihydrofolate reductase